LLQSNSHQEDGSGGQLFTSHPISWKRWHPVSRELYENGGERHLSSCDKAQNQFKEKETHCSLERHRNDQRKMKQGKERRKSRAFVSPPKLILSLYLSEAWFPKQHAVEPCSEFYSRTVIRVRSLIFQVPYKVLVNRCTRVVCFRLTTLEKAGA
jgi:hypothetical protein